MVAVVVLGITAAGMVGLSMVASRGLSDSASYSTAMDIAAGRAELYSVEGPDGLVARGCGFFAGGCINAANPSATPPGVLPTPPFPGCVLMVDGAESAGAVTTGKYRVDTSVVANAAGGFDVQIAVCWVEDSRTRRIETRRLVAPRERG